MDIDPNFESLLETEPQPEERGEDYRNLHKSYSNLNSTLSSAADRIKDLEGVLVTVRGFAATAAARIHNTEGLVEALQGIAKLVNEALDPCKPWCVLDEPGHGGACYPDEETR